MSKLILIMTIFLNSTLVLASTNVEKEKLEYVVVSTSLLDESESKYEDIGMLLLSALGDIAEACLVMNLGVETREEEDFVTFKLGSASGRLKSFDELTGKYLDVEGDQENEALMTLIDSADDIEHDLDADESMFADRKSIREYMETVRFLNETYSSLAMATKKFFPKSAEHFPATCDAK